MRTWGMSACSLSVTLTFFTSPSGDTFIYTVSSLLTAASVSSYCGLCVGSGVFSGFPSFFFPQPASSVSSMLIASSMAISRFVFMFSASSSGLFLQ